MPDSKTKICYCSLCRRDTNHIVLQHEYECQDVPDLDYFRTDYYIVKCLGCDNIQFYREQREEGSYICLPDGTWKDDPYKTTYPNTKNLVDPVETYILPYSLGKLYAETIDCLNRGNYQLAAAGFRAVIEAICADKSISGSNLSIKINNLAKQHIVTANDRDNLHAVRFIGNDSIHCIKTYTANELIVVAKIINSILTSLYIIPDQVKVIKEKPIKDYEEFIKVVDDRIKEIGVVGNIDTLKNFVKHERRIISDCLPEFESELISNITKGIYTHLSLCPKKEESDKQQYKIESVDF